MILFRSSFLRSLCVGWFEGSTRVVSLHPLPQGIVFQYGSPTLLGSLTQLLPGTVCRVVSSRFLPMTASLSLRISSGHLRALFQADFTPGRGPTQTAYTTCHREVLIRYTESCDSYESKQCRLLTHMNRVTPESQLIGLTPAGSLLSSEAFSVIVFFFPKRCRWMIV